MKLHNLESVRSLAVVGATGLVGQEFLSILAEHKIRIPKLKLFASEESLGEQWDVGGQSLTIEPLASGSFEGIDVAFFSVPAEVTNEHAPRAAAAGSVVIDDSHLFRLNLGVPLIVPSVNGAELRDFQGQIVAIPNCTTTPLAQLLAPLSEAFALKRVVVSSYQSVSGAGRAAFDALSSQTISLMNGQSELEEVLDDDEQETFHHPYAFNCIPMIGEMREDGDCTEEAKVRLELRKILNLPSLRVAVQTVRVPTFCGHGMSVFVEFEESFDSVESVRELMEKASGVRVLDKPQNSIFPTNRECVGSDDTFVGRIRRDSSVSSGVTFWAMTDNLRRGAALTALECIDLLYHYRRMS